MYTVAAYPRSDYLREGVAMASHIVYRAAGCRIIADQFYHVHINVRCASRYVREQLRRKRVFRNRDIRIDSRPLVVGIHPDVALSSGPEKRDC